MKYLIAVPCMDMVQTPFVCSLVAMQPLNGPTEITFGANSLIYDTRNQLADKAVREGFDRVLWLDSDMTFSPDLARRLSTRLDEGCEYVSAFYTTRKNPIRPCVFKNFTADPPVMEFYEDYPRNSLFEIAGSGFGGVMVSTGLIRRVLEAYGRPFSPILGVGEDLSFCARARALGARLYCDSSIKMGHIGFTEFTESTYIERLEHEK